MMILKKHLVWVLISLFSQIIVAQIFTDDVLNESVGTFPSKWDPVDGTAAVNVAPTGEKAIEIEHLSIIRPKVNGKLDGYLGPEFTISFKVFFNDEQYIGRQQYLIRLWDGNNYHSGDMRMGPITVSRNGAQTSYFDPKQKTVNKMFPPNTPENGYDPNTGRFSEMWRTVKLEYKDEALSLYLDERFVFEIPKMPLQPSMFSIGAVEKWRQARDYFTAYRDVAIFDSAGQETPVLGCDALLMELIDGKWMIEDENSGSLEGMVVNVKGDFGLVSVTGNSGYERVEKIWQEIKPYDDYLYEFKHTDADGTVSDGMIERYNIDEIRVTYRANLANPESHKWGRLRKYRDGGIISSNGGTTTGGSSGDGTWPKELPSQIDDSVVLTGGPPGTEVDYYADYVVDVRGYLEISPGVTIQFGKSGGLGVYDEGWLVIGGVASEPVTLRTKEGNDSWRGIHIETKKMNGIYGAIIENAGGNYVFCCNEPAAIYLKDGNLTLSDAQVINSEGCGVYLYGDSSLEQYNNQFSGNKEGDICEDE